MSTTLTFVSGGPFPLFGQTLSSGSIVVHDLRLALGRSGVGPDAVSYMELKQLLDRGLVTASVDGESFAGTQGFDDAVDASIGSPGYGYLLFGLDDFREMSSDGDVGAIAANGGILASDTTPIRKATNGVQEISWAAGNSDIVGANRALGPDFDGTKDVVWQLLVYTDNTGGGGIEAATFTLSSIWDGGTAVSDTITDSTPATTVHEITGTVAAADVPNTPRRLDFMLTLGTHAADPVQMVACRVRYSKKAPPAGA